MNSLLFSLCLTFTVSTKIGKSLPLLLKAILMWEHPCTACVCPVALVRELNLMWTQSCLSLWCAVSSHLGGTWSWVTRVRNKCEPELPSAQWLYCPLWAGSGPALLEWKSWDCCRAGSVPLRCVSSLSQHWHPCPGVELLHQGLQGSWYRLQGVGCGHPTCSKTWTALDALPVWASIMVASVLLKCQFGWEPPLCLRGFCDV